MECNRDFWRDIFAFHCLNDNVHGISRCLVHARLQSPLGHLVLLDHVHYRSPSAECISVDSLRCPMSAKVTVGATLDPRSIMLARWSRIDPPGLGLAPIALLPCRTACWTLSLIRQSPVTACQLSTFQTACRPTFAKFKQPIKSAAAMKGVPSFSRPVMVISVLASSAQSLARTSNNRLDEVGTKPEVLLS